MSRPLGFSRPVRDCYGCGGTTGLSKYHVDGLCLACSDDNRQRDRELYNGGDYCTILLATVAAEGLCPVLAWGFIR